MKASERKNSSTSNEISSPIPVERVIGHGIIGQPREPENSYLQLSAASIRSRLRVVLSGKAMMMPPVGSSLASHDTYQTSVTSVRFLDLGDEMHAATTACLPAWSSTI